MVGSVVIVERAQRVENTNGNLSRYTRSNRCKKKIRQEDKEKRINSGINITRSACGEPLTAIVKRSSKSLNEKREIMANNNRDLNDILRSADTSVDDLLVLERTDPEVFRRPYNGRPPLQFALMNDQSNDVLHYLIDQWPESVRMRDQYGSLPIHRACAYGVSLVIIRRLAQLYPESLRMLDGDWFGGLPLHNAAGGSKR